MVDSIYFFSLFASLRASAHTGVAISIPSLPNFVWRGGWWIRFAFSRSSRHCEPVRTLAWQSPSPVCQTSFGKLGMVDSICIFIPYLGNENKCSAASSRSGQRSSALHLDGFETTPKQKRDTPKGVSLFWWGMVDSNHRRHSQQIYSLSPLATREIPHIQFLSDACMEPVDGLVQSRFGSVQPSPATLVRVALNCSSQFEQWLLKWSR